MKTVLVTGGDGQLGTELRRFEWPDGWDIHAIDVDALDLRDAAAIAAMVGSREWAAVINAAAYTAVDQAESDLVTAWQVNALAPAALAAACARAAIPIVHISTDYVFDGRDEGAREPGDPVRPINVYGASKLGGELAVASSLARYVIVRTAWVVSAHGSNFIKTMLRLAAEREELRVVADQHGSPTAAADLAAALASVTMRLVDDPAAPIGLYHFTNSGPTTWHGFATEIFAQSTDRGGPSPHVTPISAADYPTPALRPAHSLLSCATLTRDYGIVARPWHQALGDILDELLGTKKP